jgi:hypothetical protein
MRNLIKEIQEKMPEVYDHFCQNYVCSLEVMKALYTAQVTDNNIILFGRGGYGKSQMTKDWFDLQGISYFKVDGNPNMRYEQLMGGVDMLALKEKGKTEYLMEDSFMNHEYVIFEEGLDIPVHVISALKSILEDKEFVQNGKRIPIKTKMIVMLTNKRRSEVQKDWSSSAIMERFPLELEVDWGNMNGWGVYDQLFRKRLGETMTQFAMFTSDVNTEHHISPRMALHAAKLFQKGLDQSIGFVDGYNEYIRKNSGIIDKCRESVNFSKALQDHATVALELEQLLKKTNKNKTAITELANLEMEKYTAFMDFEYDVKTLYQKSTYENHCKNHELLRLKIKKALDAS